MKPIPTHPPEPAPLLAFGAHPDDIEFGCGGVIVRETRAGRSAHMVVCSRGEAASHGTPAQRTAEAEKAAALLGATLEFVLLDGDARLELRVPHAVTLAGVIRRLRPGILLAPSPEENQHPDHSRLGRLVRDAARLARYGGVKELRELPPHAITHLFFYALTPESEPAGISPVLLDISAPEILAAWTAAMEAHASQTRAREYVELQLTRARLHGLRAGIGQAMALYPNDALVLQSLAQLSRAHAAFDMDRLFRIGMTCYPSVGGSGILASMLGEELARRGHEIHFISYECPFRFAQGAPRLFFHPVVINDYGLFKYPDYTLPLSVKMAEVTRDYGLDILHVHYAVPHATAAILARSMLPPEQQPRVVATLHGTDTTLLGRDPGYGPAIKHALACSDAISTVSAYLRTETQRLFSIERRIDVIHNFFQPRPPRRSRAEVRGELGLRDEVMILHSSNLRPVKRIDLLLETAARIRPSDSFKLVILAGASFSPFAPDVRRLGLESQVIVRERVLDIEEYLQAADLALFTSDSESFCLSILEAMYFGCPSVATCVGGIPEVATDNATALLTPPGDVSALAAAVEHLIRNPARRAELGAAARQRARERFSADVIVPQYEALYRRVREG